MEKIKCSVWNNGQHGWGIKVLRGHKIRHRYFKRKISPIVVEIEGVPETFNVDKPSFWIKTCGALIRSAPIRRGKEVHFLEAGNRV